MWSTRIGKVGNPDQQPNDPAARSTPTVDGAMLYALGSDGDLVCLETATGKMRWSKSLRIDFAGQPGTWAYAESPLVDGGVVVSTPGGAQSTFVALSKNTGDVVWRGVVPGGARAGYSSIVVSEAVACGSTSPTQETACSGSRRRAASCSGGTTRRRVLQV